MKVVHELLVLVEHTKNCTVSSSLQPAVLIRVFCKWQKKFYFSRLQSTSKIWFFFLFYPIKRQLHVEK